MAYGDFTMQSVSQRFGLTVEESTGLVGDVPEVELPPGLGEMLDRYLPVALNQNTEKARSEFVIAPLLMELKLKHRDRVSLFSGIDFTVDASVGLNGRCDYILARSPMQLMLAAPVCVLVEAKREDIVAGIPQCLAEMVAAQRFNRAAGQPEGTVYGAVTTGVLWRFLLLDGERASVDTVEYPIYNPRKIFGILTRIMGVG